MKFLGKVVLATLAVAGGNVHAALGSSDSLNFLVMGDWGGKDCLIGHDCTTPQEKETAKGMQKIGDEQDATFAVALGDNFYSYGIRSDVHDKRFKYTFEDVFTNKIPFHVISGNHDHRGNVSAEIAYTQLSKRWNYPSLYYTFTEGPVQFVMIDTVVLSGNCHVENSDDELAGNKLPGPADSALADSQMQWIEKTLNASKAEYVVVAGHYPVYSICEHGPTSDLVDHLKPLLERYKVSAYMNGHDHCAQFIDVGDGVQYHTIGSAHENNPDTSHKGSIPAGSLKFHTGKGDGGFSAVKVDSNGMAIEHRDGDGTLLYTAPAIPPRTFETN
jgi:phosphodiesterase/alkaline phosphatase D-like protein